MINNRKTSFTSISILTSAEQLLQFLFGFIVISSQGHELDLYREQKTK